MELPTAAVVATLALFAHATQSASAGDQIIDGFSISSSSALKMPKAEIRGQLWQLRRDSDASAIELVIILAPQTSTVVSIRPTLARGRASELFQPSLCSSSLVVTNGSFYIAESSGARPLGLVRVAGKTLGKPSQRKSGGFLAIESGKPVVFKRKDVDAAMASTDAIESTPILIEGGASGMKNNDGIRFDRVAVGNASKGFSIIAGAFGDDQNSVSLFEFEKLVQAASTALGAAPLDVIAMDGGPSAHIYLPDSDQLFGYKGSSYLPNVVCLGAK